LKLQNIVKHASNPNDEDGGNPGIFFISENNGKHFKEQLIFPINRDNTIRISEQELRVLFIDELKNIPDIFYSIETPTKNKYKFGFSLEDIKLDKNGKSASVDLTIFKKNGSAYKRILNIEFKYSNGKISQIAKDILKLISEEENGAFIWLLKNTNRETLPSVLNKIYKSLKKYKNNWKNDTYIEIVILSLEKQTNKNKKAFLIYKKITKNDLLDEILNLKNWQKIEIENT